MPMPIVAIVGRTNVGKSTLFNRIVGHQLAVVDDFPGVTRDRLYAEVAIGGRPCILVDTGGLVGAESDELILQVTEQAAAWPGRCASCSWTASGASALDHEVADVVRKTGKPVFSRSIAPNTENLEDFYELALGRPHRISARTGYGLQGLSEEIIKQLPAAAEPSERVVGEVALAFVGRPNVGKSAIINALLGEERVIVSDVPGTTRDAVDIVAEYEGRPLRLIDTAGLRRRSYKADGAEYYSSLRTIRALQRADVGVLVLDASAGLTRQDERIWQSSARPGHRQQVGPRQDMMPAVGAQEDQAGMPENTTVPIMSASCQRLPASTMRLHFTSALTGEVGALLLAAVVASSSTGVWRPAAQSRIRDAMIRHQAPARGGRARSLLCGAGRINHPLVLKTSDPGCATSPTSVTCSRLRGVRTLACP